MEECDKEVTENEGEDGADELDAEECCDKKWFIKRDEEDDAVLGRLEADDVAEEVFAE